MSSFVRSFASATRDAPSPLSRYWACEDPFLWRTADGNFHVLFHHSDGRTKEDLGGHAFSSDGGRTWTISATNAYGNNYTQDGTPRRFKRPQRPQLHVSDDGAPLMLILGVAGDHLNPSDPGMCDPPSSGPNCDKSWTLGVPTRAYPYTSPV